MLRQIVPVTTICMHGSPLSRFDNREIWTKYNYRELGILGEASLDIDFTTVAYFTDTGRRWDGAGVSVRDKAGRGDLETERRRDSGTERMRDAEFIGSKHFVRSKVQSTSCVQSSNQKSESPERTDTNQFPFDSIRSVRVGITDLQSPITNPPPPCAPCPVPQAPCPMPCYRHTRDLIHALRSGTFPAQAMITLHPQRWNDAFLPWLQEWVWQNLKNQVKRFIVRRLK